MTVILERFSLAGRTALVTGASGGLGAAIAISLAEAGADVVCHGNARGAEETCTKIEKLGRRAAAIHSDLSCPEAAEELFAKATSFSAIDIVVNNAGTIRRAPAQDLTEQDWDVVLQVNLNSVFKLCQLAGRQWIREQSPGKIVNIASLLSFQGGVSVASYAASKGAVAQLTKALANEWAKHGIGVNAIAPGYIRTNNTLALQHDGARNGEIVARIPAGRWGEPEDVCGAAVFLASQASNYVSGHVLVVDGGWMAR